MPAHPGLISRRGLLGGCAALATGCGSLHPVPADNSRVAILSAPTYAADLEDLIHRGIRECGLSVRGRRVLLKPNLVEFSASAAINTDVAVLAAAVEVFERLGAASVTIGEGPGHRRDTMALAEEAGYRREVPGFDSRFVDLNTDDVARVPNFAGAHDIYLPHTALAADLVVSLAKMKTHHWAGATLSMKNLFGVVPGSVYGWPKNQLHYFGIAESIVALYRLFPRSFAIVDGIVGMEGNGPIQGRPKHSGVLVMGRDMVAVDATCCRLMGMDAQRLDYLTLASSLGHVQAARIEQCGEALAAFTTEFALIPRFTHLRARSA